MLARFLYNTQAHNSTRYSQYYLRHLMAPTVPIRPTNVPRIVWRDLDGRMHPRRLNNAWGEVRDNLTKAMPKRVKQPHTTVTPSKRTFRNPWRQSISQESSRRDYMRTRKLKNLMDRTLRSDCYDKYVMVMSNLVIQKSERGKKILIHTNEVKLFKRK